MNHPELNTDIFHGIAPCPVCEHTVHVVGDRQRHRARWVCTQCKTVGIMPLLDAEDVASIDGASSRAAA